MAQFKARESKAAKHKRMTKWLRFNSVKPMPMEAYRVDHTRPGDSHREVGSHKGPNATPWKGARGKQKQSRQCKS